MTLLILIMTPFIKSRFLIAYAVCFLILSSISRAEIKRYSSGLGRDWDFYAQRIGDKKLPPQVAAAEFIGENFGQFDGVTRWELRKTVSDATHQHLHYWLKYKNRRVLGVGLSLHYNLNGFIEYADSGLEELISLNFEPDSPSLRQSVAERAQKNIEVRIGGRYSTDKWEPVLFKKGENWIPSFIMRTRSLGSSASKQWVVDQTNGAILFEISTSRNFRDTTTSVKVYKDSVVSDGGTGYVSQNITTSDATLTSSEFHVVREENSGSSGKKEVAPADYTSETAFKVAPEDYNLGCSGSSTGCANQSFDAVNVFYHLQQYRGSLDPYFSSLGFSLSNDPLLVIVRTYGSELNNARFVPDPIECGSLTEDRCLIFFPPGLLVAGDFPDCAGNLQVNNLAREGFVIVHEYQHYVTDYFSGIGALSAVGGIIHEGYSDYAAASQMTLLNNKNITQGLVSFPACSLVRRDVGVKTVYQESDEFSDPHYAGLSWASGLWALHEEYGENFSSEIADKIMLKSLVFLGEDPGFVSSVESLVKADRALYSGQHVERIREIFYSENKFLGSAPGVFKDPATTEAYLGFKGCSGVKWSSHTGTAPFSSVAFLIWGLITLGLGRFLSERPVL